MPFQTVSMVDIAIGRCWRSWCTLNLWWRTDRLSPHDDIDDDHRRTAVRADEGRLTGLGWRIDQGTGIDIGHDNQQLTRPGEVVAALRVGKQPVMPNAMKAARQYV